MYPGIFGSLEWVEFLIEYDYPDSTQGLMTTSHGPCDLDVNLLYLCISVKLTMNQPEEWFVP